MRCWRYERKGGGWGDKGRKQHMSVLKGILNVDDPLRCFIDSKSSCHGQPAEHGQHRQHSWLPFWNAQMKRKLRRTAAALGRGRTGIREPCTTYFAAFGKQCNGKPVSVFGGQLANLANWPTVLLTPRKPSSCLYDLCTADREDLLPEHTAARLQIAASRCKTCVSDEALSPATGDFINQTSS